MAMTEDFKSRLFHLLPEIKKDFRQPMIGDNTSDMGIDQLTQSGGFFVYDEKGIRETIRDFKKNFFGKYPGNNFFAVKACPNGSILKIMLEEGFGLDCASPAELHRAYLAGAKPEQIMYSSNNTNPNFYEFALPRVGILNLDDISFIDKLPYMPDRICFRYNPGERRQEGTNDIIGTPIDQKYGLRHDQIIDAYRIARDRGAKRFGIHTMYASNCLDPFVLAGNAKMQLDIVKMIGDELDIKFDFINIGGGLGINYRLDQNPLDISTMAELINLELDKFHDEYGYVPKLYLESGRYITGPHGVLVGTVINKMDKYKKFIGHDFCDAADILRALIYSSSRHELSVINKDGLEKRALSDGNGAELVTVVGPLCENFHMAKNRHLPIINEGDFIVVQDAGAHAIAMAMHYNSWNESMELLLTSDNRVRCIARAGIIKDLLVRESAFFGQVQKEIQY